MHPAILFVGFVKSGNQLENPGCASQSISIGTEKEASLHGEDSDSTQLPGNEQSADMAKEEEISSITSKLHIVYDGKLTDKKTEDEGEGEGESKQKGKPENNDAFESDTGKTSEGELYKQNLRETHEKYGAQIAALKQDLKRMQIALRRTDYHVEAGTASPMLANRNLEPAPVYVGGADTSNSGDKDKMRSRNHLWTAPTGKFSVSVQVEATLL
ncbi:MAG: hypothetical protein Q9170_002245 [Blastenia crenularia]